MILCCEIATTTTAQDAHLWAFAQGCSEWTEYQNIPFAEKDMVAFEDFVVAMLGGLDLSSDDNYQQRLCGAMVNFKTTCSKPQKWCVITKYCSSQDVLSSAVALNNTQRKKSVR